MSKRAPSPNSSDNQFRQLSSIDESLASVGLGPLDSEHGVILKDWSAQDFSNIYVRFRPHLISHARKFLRDGAQAEEVVQDAFLYLMTALPELDSELGVLRFLKWKTKMLCFDVIRLSKSGLQGNLIPLPDDLRIEADFSEPLERAEDVAIINLALAKLSPRQREALIATTYEEKSASDVASQMGLEENAFRQLLYRARKSFRIALLGEARIEGKSAAEILSMAAKRARPKLMVPVLVMIAGMVLPLMPSQDQVNHAADSIDTSNLSGNNTFADFDRAVAPKQVAKENVVSTSDSGLLESALAAEDPAEAIGVDAEFEPGNSLAVIPEIALSERGEVQRTPRLQAFNEFLGASMIRDIDNREFGFEVSADPVLTIQNQSGLKVSLAFDIESEKVVQFLSVHYDKDGISWMAVPGNSLTVIERSGDTLAVSYAATDFLVGDFSGHYDYVSTQDSAFSRSGIKIDLLLSESGQVVDASATFMPKT